MALLYLNLAVLSKHRAALSSANNAATLQTLHVAGVLDEGKKLVARAEVEHLQLVVRYQREAYTQVGYLRGRSPQLRGHVVAQLAQVHA